VLLPLEEAIVEVAVRRLGSREPDFHGFALAEELEAGAGDRLLGFGTLYKALARLERDGLLVSTWETIDPTVVGRPRRRLYRATTDAASALARSRALQAAVPSVRARWSPA
jgi:DNA-binding PadR family transcriptional regulator